ncbi:MAG TPA: TrmH family RNA methyltransferase [Actinomycetota bacterium]|nr:TrmH family RNA methyltransferase [Actinomycetota bacterium]
MLTSARNPKVVAAVRLKKRALREEERSFLVEGAQGVGEALAEDGRLRALFVRDPLDPIAVRAGQAGVAVEPVSDAVMDRLTSTVTPQGVVGIAPYLDVSIEDLTAPGVVAVLHEVRDPGNAGTILRSADAAGAAGVVFAGNSVDVYNPKSVRASAGSIFHVPVVRDVGTADALVALRGAGFAVVAMDTHGDDDLFDTELPVAPAFVFGNEAQGLPGDILQEADRRIRVPQAGRAESLNLAAAATICLFEWVRRGRAAPETLEALVAAAAHDVRSPLTAIKAFGYALGRRWTDMTDEQRDVMLNGIVHDADRMDTIVRQLLDAARVMSGSFQPYLEITDMGDLVRQIAEQQARDPDHPAFEWSGGVGAVLVDAGRLRTTLLAFAEALVWWGGGGPIRVAGALRDGRITVTESREAADDVDPEVLFRARQPGTGGGSKIGLFVARRVAEASGGRAWGERSGGRLAFHVELPASGPDADTQ